MTARSTASGEGMRLFSAFAWVVNGSTGSFHASWPQRRLRSSFLDVAKFGWATNVDDCSMRLLFVRTPRSIGTLVLGNLLQDFIIDESRNLADREWIWNRYGTAYRVTGQKVKGGIIVTLKAVNLIDLIDKNS